VIGDYVFPGEFHRGDMLLFGDMAIYSMCKNNTFNGMPLPDILCRCEDGEIRVVRQFGYEDFKRRLGSVK
jgi:carboxynorspermidine decarboxylase